MYEPENIKIVSSNCGYKVQNNGIKEYKCHWPGCTMKTTDRSQIELHHISPKELGNRLNSGVTLSFCPTHHRLIYHPECKHGHHSIPAANKLQILHIYPTAPDGYAVEYKNMLGKVWFECFDGDYRNTEDNQVQE